MDDNGFTTRWIVVKMDIYGKYIDSYKFDSNFIIAMNTESFFYNEAFDYHMGAGTLQYGGY